MKKFKTARKNMPRIDKSSVSPRLNSSTSKILSPTTTPKVSRFMPKLDKIREYILDNNIESSPQREIKKFVQRSPVISIHIPTSANSQNQSRVYVATQDGIKTPQKKVGHRYSTSVLLNSNITSGQMTDRKLLIQKEEQLSSLKIKNEQILKVYNEFEEKFKLIESQEDVFLKSRNSHRQIFTPVKNQTVEQQSEVTDQQNDHLQIRDLNYRQKNNFFIERFKFNYFRLKIKEKESPILINLKINLKLVKIFGSKHSFFPNRFNSEYHIQSKTFTIHEEEQSVLFIDDFLHISIYSQEDQIVSISFQFGTQQTKPEINKNVQQQQIFPRAYLDQFCDTLDSESDKKDDKIVQQNKILDDHKNFKRFRLLQEKAQSKETKFFETLRRKKIIDVQKKEDQLSKILVLESLKTIRKYQNEKNEYKTYKLIFQCTWLRAIFGSILVNQIQTALLNSKRRKLIIARGRLQACRFYTIIMRNTMKTGDNQQQRTLFKMNLALKLRVKHLKRKVKKKVAHIFSNFFRESALFIQMMRHHSETSQKIIIIQRRFRQVVKMRKHFKEKIIKLIDKSLIDIIFGLKHGFPLAEGQGPKSFLKGGETKNQFAKQFILDKPLLNNIINEFIMEKKRNWLDYLANVVFSKKKLDSVRVLQAAFNYQEPRQFQTPSQDELLELIVQYARAKKYV